MKIKKIVFLLFGLLVGCTSPITLMNTPPNIPEFHVQQIPRVFKGMSKEQVEAKVEEYRHFKHHLDYYIEQINEQVLNRRYHSDRERKFVCDVVGLKRLVELPPKPNIKDDGSISDDQLIKILVSHLRQLVSIIRNHNKEVERDFEQYLKRCTNRYDTTSSTTSIIGDIQSQNK